MNITQSECRDYLSKLDGALQDTLSWPVNYRCDCSKKAKAVQKGLMQRIRAGDDGALDELMAYYPCFQGWLKEVISEAEWRVIALALVKNTMMEQTQGNFIVELRLALIRRGVDIYTLRLEQLTRALEQTQQNPQPQQTARPIKHQEPLAKPSAKRRIKQWLADHALKT